MSQIPGPYDNLLSHFRQHLSGPDSQLVNLALWVYGLFKARSCHLGRVADELPLEGQKDSIIQRLKRFLMNPGLVPKKLYRKLITAWLKHWPDGAELTLILDRTEVADLPVADRSVQYLDAGRRVSRTSYPSGVGYFVAQRGLLF